MRISHWGLWARSPRSWRSPACYRRSIGTSPETGWTACCEAQNCQLCVVFWCLLHAEGWNPRHLWSIGTWRNTVYNKKVPAGWRTQIQRAIIFHQIVCFQLQLWHQWCDLLWWRVAPSFTLDLYSLVKRQHDNGTRGVRRDGWKLLHYNIATHAYRMITLALKIT